MMEERVLNDIFTSVRHEMKSGNVIWEELISSGLRYVSAVRTAIAAHSQFLEVLNKVGNFSSRSSAGRDEVGALLCQLVDEQRCADELREASVKQLADGVLSPLRERVQEWNKSLDSSSTSKLNGSTKSLSKGSAENIFNRAAMTLSRRSRRGSSSKPQGQKDQQSESPILRHVNKDTVANALVEHRARMSTFVRSLSPYVASQATFGTQLAKMQRSSGSLGSVTTVKSYQIHSWLDEQIAMANGSLRNGSHARKSSVSSMNSISSSKSDSNSSGRTEPPSDLRQTLLRQTSEYRLSSTSHDSGFTSQALDNDLPEMLPIDTSCPTNTSNSPTATFAANRTNSWRNWPKPGPYDENKNTSRNASCPGSPTKTNSTNVQDQFNNTLPDGFVLPPPPPELLSSQFNELQVNTTDNNANSEQARSISSMSSAPLSPFMANPSGFTDDYQPPRREITNGLATIRRTPSSSASSPLRRGLVPTPVPVPPVPSASPQASPSLTSTPKKVPPPPPPASAKPKQLAPPPLTTRPPLPMQKPKRNGSVLSFNGFG